MYLLLQQRRFLFVRVRMPDGPFGLFVVPEPVELLGSFLSVGLLRQLMRLRRMRTLLPVGLSEKYLLP